MKTDKTTIYDLFQMQRRYVVPLFQRGYVWTQERQWEPLWEDIVAQAAETVRHRTGRSKTLQKHFLGAVVLNLTFTQLRRVPVVEIIDGQQRLTTIQVLLAALRDETAGMDNEFLKADLLRLTKNQGPFSDEVERFKVWPTSAMQEHLERVLELGTPEAIGEHYARFHQFKYGKWRPARPPLVEAYLFFAEQIRKYLDDDPTELPDELEPLSADHRAEVLVEALIKNIQLVTIELEQEDDAQVIFETLNARGEPLTPSDLVRNFVFLTAMKEEIDVLPLYDKLWKDFEEGPPEPPFWKVEERQGRLKRARLDLFLFHYVWLRRKEELKISHLYQSFKSWWDEGIPRDITAELMTLRGYAGTYRTLLDPKGKSRFADFARRLRAIDTSTAHPVVLWAADAFGVESEEFEATIASIESFLIRRAVCGYNQKAYNRIFLELLKDLDEAGSAATPGLIRLFLSKSQAESALWPSDEEFRRALVSAPLYRSLRPRSTLAILEALEQKLQHEYSEDITINSPLSIEHILPQGADEVFWPLEVREGEERSAADLRRSHLVHSLGNLTLLTQPLNSSVSNGPFVPEVPAKGKREAIVKKSKLTMNSYFAGIPIWNEAEIVRRGQALADVAVRIWPGPN